MRAGTKLRNLSFDERDLAKGVFDDSLPAWERIFVTDGLGPLPGLDRPYTEELARMFVVNVGPDYYPDLTGKVNYGFGTASNLLIHELTHVWQYYHGYSVMFRSLWANTGGKQYSYTIEDSDAWDDFNVEQQAHLVEDWFDRRSSRTDKRFVFIEKIIRAGVTGGFWADAKDSVLATMPLEKLRTFEP
jgi:hypothetical protein